MSTYAPILTKETGKINWNDSGVKIVNLIRGLKLGLQHLQFIMGENLKIHEARRIPKFIEGGIMAQ